MKKVIYCLILAFFITTASAQQNTSKPFILPVAISPGPSTWLLGQLYGNTTSAFNFGHAWYEAGQGLHFGVDFSMPCGTPLVAVADGEVVATSSASFGAGPHNLILRHSQYNVVTLYGHLLERPNLAVGQTVRQGELIALSGEPDGICTSRPHLHFEVRSLDYRTTYNPINYIEAPWHTLMNVGPFSNPMFQQDMAHARRWMSLDDQPEVNFGGALLNNYDSAWPYPLDVRPPVNPPLSRTLEILPENLTWELRPLTIGGCCAHPWWDALDANRFYFIDGIDDQPANVFQYTLDGSQPLISIEEAPPMLLSPDGSYQVTRVNGQITIRRLADMTEWVVDTQGALPAVSPGNSQLLWEIWKGSYLPGETAQTVETWVSNLDGSQARRILVQPGGWSVWLDDARVLIVTPVVDRTDTTLTIYDTRDESSYVLGTWNWLRNLSVAPGGGRLMFFMVWQSDPNADGVYTIETQAGAIPQKMPWFGGWRWRDSDSVYYIPYDATSSQHILAYYHIPSGINRYLTDMVATPLSVANADWSVAPDGNAILFRNALDMNLWLLKIP